MPAPGSNFSKTGGARPPRTAFDLSHDFKFDCNAGELIPVLCTEVYPGEVFHLKNEVVVRMQPMLAPILHEINVDTHTFFVPYRLLWGSTHSLEQFPSELGSWEEFITGNAVKVYPSTSSETPVDPGNMPEPADLALQAGGDL